MMVLLLGDAIPVGSLLAALLLYRLIYYLLPLALAMTLLLADELRQRRELVFRLTHSLGSLSLLVTPRILALFTFLAGVLLLVSGVTPAIHSRLEWLSELLPVGLLEATHFVGSLVDVVLLLLSQALARRIRLAYVAVVAALCAGIALSLLKAADWEEATILTGLLIVLISCRQFFDRQSTLFDTRFSPAWVMSILAAFGGSVWLGFFVFRHVDYSNQLWWEFALNRDASRFLRASVGAAVALAGFSVWHSLCPRNQVALLPTVAVLEQDGEVVAFANILAGSDRRELSVDLMRFRQNAPNGIMDGLFTHLFFWGQAEGYQWFNLGMAPLSGIEPSPLSGLWSRMSRLIYGHGEAFYNFEGLRAYKEKFQPAWEPRYLAYPGGGELPLILADIAALSAGGYIRIFR